MHSFYTSDKVIIELQQEENEQSSREGLAISHKIPDRNGFSTRCSKTKCIVLSHEPPSILYLLCSSPLVNCFTTRYKFVPGKSLKEEKPFFRPKKTVTELQSKDKVIKEQRSSTTGKLFYLLNPVWHGVGKQEKMLIFRATKGHLFIRLNELGRVSK